MAGEQSHRLVSETFVMDFSLVSFLWRLSVSETETLRARIFLTMQQNGANVFFFPDIQATSLSTAWGLADFDPASITWPT